ncbi:hypothetical protein AUJ38_02040 [bacterium CG1_02_42_9]|nr:MAG: hypothetical protein AUJ38_02040 [bacterium CG1_02_42_9]
MKDNKSIYLLAGFLIVLITASVGVWYISQPAYQAQKKQSSSPFAFSSIQKDALDKVTIKHGESEASLRKTDQGWIIGGVPAATDITIFLDNLSKIQVGNIVSQSEISFQMLGVDESQGFILSLLSGGEEKFKIITGSQATTSQSFYARNADSNTVYLLYGDIWRFVSRTEEDWRGKQIVAVTEDQIEKLDFVEGAENFSLIRDGDSWKVQQGGTSYPIESNAAQNIFHDLSDLTALAVLTGENGPAVENPQATLTITLKNQNQTILLSEYQKDNNYYLQRSDQKVWYQVSESVANEIFPSSAELRK